MRLYEIQWIGPPRPGGAEIIDRVIDIAPDDDAVKEHATHPFATIQKPGAHAVRIIESAGREVHLWVPGDDEPHQRCTLPSLASRPARRSMKPDETFLQQPAGGFQRLRGVIAQ